MGSKSSASSSFLTTRTPVLFGIGFRQDVQVIKLPIVCRDDVLDETFGRFFGININVLKSFTAFKSETEDPRRLHGIKFDRSDLLCFFTGGIMLIGHIDRSNVWCYDHSKKKSSCQYAIRP